RVDDAGIDVLDALRRVVERVEAARVSDHGRRGMPGRPQEADGNPVERGVGPRGHQVGAAGAETDHGDPCVHFAAGLAGGFTLARPAAPLHDDVSHVPYDGVIDTFAF